MPHEIVWVIELLGGLQWLQVLAMLAVFGLIEKWPDDE